MRYFIVLCLIMSFTYSLSASESSDATLATGQDIYKQTCIACHGTDGQGELPGMVDLTKKNGALSKPDKVLLKNITEGFQSPGSMFAMPAKGGNPTLSDAEIKAVLYYLQETFVAKK